MLSAACLVRRAACFVAAAALAALFVMAQPLVAAKSPPQAEQLVEEPGVSGYVLDPDGAPVSGGTVVAQAGLLSTTVPVDRAGRFRFVARRSGFQLLQVSVPGFAPYRVAVDVRPSRRLRLPVIRLARGSYFRVRLVASTGEPIVAPQILWQWFDASGKPIFSGPTDRSAESIESDGAITIGPLPRGTMTLALDMWPFARTRLSDVGFGDDTKIVDGGTIAIQQPGGVLNVDVLDAAGAPVPNHDVHIEDPRPRSPLVFRPVRTNPQGRATFDRLAAGRYRVWTTAPERCGTVSLAVSRGVALSGAGTVEIPLVVGGRATFRITSPLGAVRGAAMSAAPSVPAPPSPFPAGARSSRCGGVTDADGRVTLANFPPGPAHIDVQMANSTYVRQVEVPSDGREVAVAIPDGFLPVRIVNALDNQAVSGASVVWTGGGGRVEAAASPAGEALLEGVGTGGGALTASARGYQQAEEPLDEPPGVPHTIGLTPVSPPARVRVRVNTASGEPVPDAAIELVHPNRGDVPYVAVTDANGAVTLSDVPPGSQLIASADGFVTLSMRVGEAPGGQVSFTLSRGYRVIASVGGPAAAGPELVRVVNDSNQSVDGLLDGESDRRVETPGRVSLGPLGPGVYVIELRGQGGRRAERVRIVDRDAYAIFR